MDKKDIYASRVEFWQILVKESLKAHFEVFIVFEFLSFKVMSDRQEKIIITWNQVRSIQRVRNDSPSKALQLKLRVTFAMRDLALSCWK